MSINFPLSPTLEQIYTFADRSWRWDGRAWRTFNTSVGYTGSAGESSFSYGPTAPSNPAIGDRWYDSVDGAELVYTNDGDSAQWVEVAASGFLGQTGYTGSTGSGGGPKITNIDITDSSYTLLDDTAVSTDGGYIKITGSGFESGCQILINNIPATSTTFISGTEVRAQVPATAAGTYIVYLVNTDGGVAIRINGITFSGTPTWVTGSGLSGDTDKAISIQLSASGAVSYSLAAGSTLPPGLTLSAGGLLSGTVTGINVETVYNFTVNAVDAELQDSPRSFSITITAGDPQIKYVTALLSPDLEVLPFNDDASTNNFPITVVGDTRPNNFGPYTPGYYSNFFDGTGDYLTVPGNTAFQFGTGDFTIETWVYPQNTSGTGLFEHRSAPSNIYLWYLTSTNLYPEFFTGVSYTGNISVPINRWSHLAVTRQSGTLRQFVNGVLAYSGTGINTALDSTGTIRIMASNDSAQYLGYASNIRVVKGTAVYTAAFTPPTQPLTAITNTSLLTCQSNRFTDNSTNNFVITRNGDTRIDGFDPFVPATEFSGRGSAYFDGTGDYLTVPPGTPTYLSSDLFTIEAWVYPNADNGVIVGRRAAAAARGFFLGYGTGGLANRFSFWAGDTDVNTWNLQLNSTNTFPLNQWYHVAATRSSSNVFTLWVNGVSEATGTSNFAIADNTSTLQIGILDTASSPLNGYISNLRIVKNTALYTANFTPPAAPLTAVAGTSLLTLQNNQPVNNNTFLDSSTNNFLITRNGNTTQGAFSPYGGGWSNYFDGNGDYLSVADNAALQYGTGDFTVEAWIYVTTLATAQPIFEQRASGVSTLTFVFYVATNGKLSFYVNPSPAIDFDLTVTTNSWNHVALVRQSGVMYCYLNGVKASNSIAWTGNNTTSINRIGAAYDGANINGYISNFRIVKGTAVYTANFTPSTTPLQPIANTSLLTCRDGSFVDDSANRFAMTVVGNTSVQKFGPFAGTTLPTPYYSAYFDGTGDFLTLSSAPVAATGTFTVECWVYVTGTAAAQSIYGQYLGNPSPAAGRWSMLWNDAANKFSFSIAATSYASASTYSANTWYHIAWVRDGSNNLSLYVNGVRDSITAGVSTSLYTGNPIIGARSDGTTPYTGYISNFRVTNTVVYSGTTYIVPTTPLTAISGTTVLTCQSPTFIDNSTNQLTITAAGNSQPTFFNPFTVTYSTLQSYSPSVFGGSMYFDGTGDFLRLPSNASLALGTSDFTLECWVYATSTPSDVGIFESRTNGVSTTVDGFTLTAFSSSVIRIFSNGVLISSSGTSYVNTWCHVAVTRSSGTWYLFINGVSQGTSATSRNLTNTDAVIGAGRYTTNSTPSAFFPGYISDVRIIKGQALYTSNFVPSNQPLTAVQNSVLLLNGTGAGIYDVSTLNNLETVGDARISTAVVKYGSTSMSFDGTGDYVVQPTSINYGYGTGDFTIEFWVYFNTVSSDQTIVSNLTSTSSVNPHIYLLGSGSTIRYYTNSADRIVGSAVSINTWYHVAVSRTAGSTRLFINGTQSGSTYTDSNNYGTSAPLGVGTYYSAGAPVSSATLNGYISDLRITKGYARYTANFTPPTAAFKKK
jgi:hypothetical protein